MTQAETEAELQSLHAQVSRLQQQRDGDTRHCRRWASISACTGVAALIASMVLYAIAPAVSYDLFYASLPFGFLSLAFGSAARQASNPPGAAMRP